MFDRRPENSDAGNGINKQRLQSNTDRTKASLDQFPANEILSQTGRMHICSSLVVYGWQHRGVRIPISNVSDPKDQMHDTTGFEMI